jgi:TonB family protein
LRCGLEFVALSPAQRQLIVQWEQWTAQARPSAKPSKTAAVSKPAEQATVARPAIKPHSRSRRLPWTIAATVVLLGFFGWWQWQRAWNELEQQIPVPPAATGQPRVTVSEDVILPLLTHKVDAVYPEAARQANLQGVVVLRAVIGKDGTVIDLGRISGPDQLASAAMDAVRWWRFQPYQVNREPVEVETTVTLEFRTGQ